MARRFSLGADMAKDNFRRCLEFTLQFEGGWSDHPRDPGGATMKGITLATFSQYLGRRATKTELRNITTSQMESIYRLRYWNLVDGDKLPAGVDLMLFDVAVNSGAGRAHSFDDATATLRPYDRIKTIDGLRMGFWKRCRDKAGRLLWPVFGKGWTSREKACVTLAMQMALGH